MSLFVSRIPRVFRKRLTFSNAAGSGAVGTVAVGTVTGQVLVEHVAGYCSTDLTSGGSATIEMGVSGDTAGLLAQITATDLDSGEFWEGTPSAIAASVTAKVVNGDIIVTVGTAALTAGVVDVVIYFLPLSADGNIS